MLEIILIGWMARKLSATAKSKGRSGWWGGLGPLFWIGGEIIGGIMGVVMGMEMGAYLLALVGAAIGAAIAFSIVNNLGEENPYELPEDLEPAPIGTFDPSNPYSPPGTYPAG